jgi:ribA/ribD-fused uncharacterized protein
VAPAAAANPGPDQVNLTPPGVDWSNPRTWPPRINPFMAALRLMGGLFWATWVSFEAGEPLEELIPFYSSEPTPFSNFAPAMFWHGGAQWPSAELCYQWTKLTFLGLWRHAARIADWRRNPLSPLEAKRLGRAKCPSIYAGRDAARRRDEWEAIKVNTLQQIQFSKFSQNPELGRELLLTGSAKLVEASTDRFWGVGFSMAQFRSGEVTHPWYTSNPWGQNACGEALMRVRADLLALQMDGSPSGPPPAPDSDIPTAHADLPAAVAPWAANRRAARRRAARRQRQRALRRYNQELAEAAVGPVILEGPHR